ncbi:peptidoglycan synthetase [Fulvivirga sp. M361]|uniref:UDP-N-acetylmuramate--L-alanine ligase n=1 Tax=Fulvivirga sp. M361 TaxID=2594266 RepID=UPI00117BDDE1|nr:Mur ligase family protein [Fulvivirga sp. M361]TRX49457.1 peptidoglycan synthetase [Fulvivirga sp. M361]
MDNRPQHIHFIAIGGSIMHNLAIALHHKGHIVTGSDDELFEPSKSKLEAVGLLPPENGWHPDKVHDQLDAIILGMHARKDNPELLKAQKLGLKIYSFPEFIYEQSLDKHRVVIAGSHGKTTITSMIMHVLNYFGRKFDYAVGASIQGFNTMVQLSDAPLIIIEGDEYLSSPIDPTPKFLKYHHHIGLISGVAWDHVNVFPSEDEYVKQFDAFADATPKAGAIVYCEEDAMTSLIGSKERTDVSGLPYKTHPHIIENGVTYLLHDDMNIPLKVFGQHNLQNISGAMAVLSKIGIRTDQFYEAISNFEGASKRMELVKENEDSILFKDYAHSPSKVKATTRALRDQYPERDLVACLELHTFSSLTKDFLSEYKGTMRASYRPVVYFNPDTLTHKGLAPISKEDITIAFDERHLKVFDDREALIGYLKDQNWKDKNLLMMSSGTFDNLDFDELKHIID